MKNICYLTYYTFPEVHGGAPIYAYKLANYFTKKGHNTVLLGRKRAGSSREFNFNGIVIKTYNALRFNLTQYNRIIDKNITFPLIIYRKVINECRNFDFLHIVSSSLFYPIGYVIKRRYNKKIIVSVIEDLWSDPYNSIFSKLLFRYARWQFKKALKYADIIIVHSDYALENIKMNHPKYENKIIKIYEGIDRIITKKLEKQNINKNNKDEIKLLIAGSLTKGKNFDIVLKSIKILKDKGLKLKLLIIGKGPLRDYLENLVNKLEIYDIVKFYGEVKHSEIAQFYHLSDIIIQPSKSEGSQPPPSVIEYLASGKPVIISDKCDMAGLLNNCTLKFNPDNEHMLSTKIEELIIDKDLRDNLGNKGKEIVYERFTNEQYMRKFERVYQKLGMEGIKSEI